MATSIPPHNLGEVIDAAVKLIDDPQTTIDDLIKIIKGPDFPTGAVIMGKKFPAGSLSNRTGKSAGSFRYGN